MAGVDGLLRMVVSNGADELRLGTDEAPRMFKRGAAMRLAIPPTDGETLRSLLEGMLTAAHDAALREQGKVELRYQLDGGQPLAVSVQRRAQSQAIDVVFRIDTSRAPIPAPAPLPAPPRRLAFTAPAAAERPAPGGAGLAPSSVALLEHVVSLGASDLHLSQRQAATVRIDGQLRRLDGADPDALERLLLDCRGDERAEFDAASLNNRSIDRALDLGDVGRFRVNIYRAGDRLAAAIRVLPGRAPSLADLHFPVPLHDLTQVPHGLVLVCGPTGSGKSATLAALANEAVRHRNGLLITLEDPIEYRLDDGDAGLVRQRQIGRDVRDFATGLRDALREDPDILLIGEMRDSESISLALTAAETGHLVLASLHSRSAAASVERIVDTYAPERQQQIRVQLADALRAVIAQRLLPRAKGAGRVPAVEILRGTHAVASLIRDGKTAQLASVIQSSRKDGMLPLERCLADLVRAGQVTLEAALAKANDATALAAFLQS